MRFSIRKKTILMMVVFALLLSGTALVISTVIIRNIVDTDYKSDADHLALTLSHLVDGDKAGVVRDQVIEIYRHTPNKVGSEEWGSPEFEEYTALFSHIMDTDEFKAIHKQLADIQNDNEVDCMYLTYVDKATKNGIYLVDAAEEDPCTPGVFDPIYEINYPSLDDPERGFPAYITDTGYGWLLTAAAPVHDSNGDVVAFAAVDISMDEIRAKESDYFYLTLLAMAGMTIIFCIAGFFIVNHFAVKPIRKLSTAAQQYCNKKEKDTNIGFADLHITTRDEIGELSDSMKQMERDIRNYVDNLVRTKEQLDQTRERAAEMTEMANKDSLTGLRNKRAYDLDALNLEDDIRVNQAEFGIVMVDMNYLKQTNDNYGHDKGDIAIGMTTRIICDTFKHSPVYRVGGDEFVVIIKNTDYNNIEGLIRVFKNSVSQKTNNTLLNPWERISAAIGYATFDRNTDACVEDVFKRADENMYAEKHRMKSKKEK